MGHLLTGENLPCGPSHLMPEQLQAALARAWVFLRALSIAQGYWAPSRLSWDSLVLVPPGTGHGTQPVFRGHPTRPHPQQLLNLGGAEARMMLD